ncbi:MAG: cytochrome c family protein, partial [Hyphomonadaceae bacterium]
PKMAFAGMRNPDDRVALIAYLRSITSNPPALPPPLPAEEATAPEGEATPADGAATTPDATEATPG